MTTFTGSLGFKGATKVNLAQTSGLPIFSQSGYYIAGWFRWVSNNAVETLYSEANTGNNTQLFYIAANPANSGLPQGLKVLIKNDAGTSQLSVTGNIVTNPGQWNHFVWTDNNGVCQMYINGVLDTANFNYTPAPSYTFNTSSLGYVNRAATVNFLTGAMVNAVVGTGIPSQAQVTALYSSGTLPPNVVGAWGLQEGSGTTANDTSGNSNTGTITTPIWLTNNPNSTFTSSIAPTSSQVISGMGVNYRNIQPNWQNDINYLRQHGVKNVRIGLGGVTTPWSLGDPTVYNSTDYWRLCAQTFAQAGFYVSMGTNYEGTITATGWSAYHDAVVAEATYNQSVGIVFGDFSIGNELEHYVDGTTITKLQMQMNLQQLATDVKAVYNLSPVSYHTDVWTQNWPTIGLGGLDILAMHPYGTIDPVNLTIVPNGYANLVAGVQAFGNKCYVSEFNLDASPGNIRSIDPNLQISMTQQYLATYIVPLFGNRKFMVYEFTEELNNTPSSYGYAMKYPDGTFNPVWATFFKPIAISRNPTIVSRPTVARNTAIINRTTVDRY